MAVQHQPLTLLTVMTRLYQEQVSQAQKLLLPLPTGETVTVPVGTDGTWSSPMDKLPTGSTVTATQNEPGKKPSTPVETTVTEAPTKETSAKPAINPS